MNRSDFEQKRGHKMWPENDNDKLVAIIAISVFSSMSVLLICDALVKIFAK